MRTQAARTLVIFSMFLIGQMSFAAPIVKIHNWDRQLPVTAEAIIDHIESQALYLSFDGEDGTCGGVVSNTQLKSFQYETNDQVILNVQFQVSQAVNYCASEAQLTCQAPIMVTLASDEIEMGEWNCEPVISGPMSQN